MTWPVPIRAAPPQMGGGHQAAGVMWTMFSSFVKDLILADLNAVVEKKLAKIKASLAAQGINVSVVVKASGLPDLPTLLKAIAKAFGDAF